MIENIIRFDDIAAYLTFYITYEHGEYTESLKVTCAEDIEHMMGLAQKEKWDELFDDYDPFEVRGIQFQGIEFYGKDSNGNQTKLVINGNHRFGSIEFVPATLLDKNADKITRIREIINE